MSNSSDRFSIRDDSLVEQLLEHAPPRQAPPAEDEAVVRDAVLAEWQAATGRIRTRRRVTRIAIAATVLLGLALSFNALRLGNVQALQVATIDRSHGAIYLLGEQSVMHEIGGLDAIAVGQIVITENDSGIGLAWGSGGSLRIDEDTRVEFTSADSVYLHYGRVYFDSQTPQAVAAISGAGFEIVTDHGSIRHLGTQYMTFADATLLQVSVREGEVAVDGNYAEGTASEGQQLTLTGAARPTIVNFKGYGEAWNWVETTAPVADVDGKTVHEFLLWIGRETGLEIAYESAAAEQKAHEGILKGNIDDMDPRDELSFRMSGEDLDYRIQSGTIYVSAITVGARP